MALSLGTAYDCLVTEKCSDPLACSLKTKKMMLFFLLFSPTVRVSLSSENSNPSVLLCAVYKTVAACSSLHCIYFGTGTAWLCPVDEDCPCIYFGTGTAWLCPVDEDCPCIYFEMGIAWLSDPWNGYFMSEWSVSCRCGLPVYLLWDRHCMNDDYEWSSCVCPVDVDCLCIYFGIGIAWMSDPVVSCGCGLSVYPLWDRYCMNQWSGCVLWVWTVCVPTIG